MLRADFKEMQKSKFLVGIKYTFICLYAVESLSYMAAGKKLRPQCAGVGKLFRIEPKMAPFQASSEALEACEITV